MWQLIYVSKADAQAAKWPGASVVFTELTVNTEATQIHIYRVLESAFNALGRNHVSTSNREYEQNKK